MEMAGFNRSYRPFGLPSRLDNERNTKGISGRGTSWLSVPGRKS
jgi:hypothetical protein